MALDIPQRQPFQELRQPARRNSRCTRKPRRYPGRRDRRPGRRRPAQFYPLLYRRADPFFYAFDCLWLDGRDLRSLALVERKRILRGLVPCQPSRLLYVGHIDGRGVDLFREVCRQDLEGVVAKQRDGV